jgi:Tfp pilus assembly protein FimT
MRHPRHRLTCVKVPLAQRDYRKQISCRGVVLPELLIVLSLCTVLYGGLVGSLGALNALQLNADCTRVMQLLEGVRLRAVLLHETASVSSEGRVLRTGSDSLRQPRRLPLAYSHAEIRSGESNRLMFTPDLYASPGSITLRHHSRDLTRCKLSISLRGQIRKQTTDRE